jgi:hypothetical protein
MRVFPVEIGGDIKRSGVLQMPDPQRRHARGGPAANLVEELLLTADDVIQKELYERAGSIPSGAFQEIQETLARWQRLSWDLISIIGRT